MNSRGNIFYYQHMCDQICHQDQCLRDKKQSLLSSEIFTNKYFLKKFIQLMLDSTVMYFRKACFFLHMDSASSSSEF